MTGIETALREGIDHLRPLAPLLAVPVLLSAANTGELEAVVHDPGAHMGIEIPFPVPVADLFTFVNTPETGGIPDSIGVPGAVPVGEAGVFDVSIGLLAVAVYILLYAVAAAAFVGSIQQYRRGGTYAFVTNARRYVTAYLGIVAVIFGSILALVVLTMAVPGLFVPVFVAALAVGYLFWGAWFLVPVADLGAVDALTDSYRLATSERSYAVWTLAYMGIGATISVFATLLVFRTHPPVIGLLFGFVVTIPAGFVLTVASLRIVEDISRQRGLVRG